MASTTSRRHLNIFDQHWYFWFRVANLSINRMEIILNVHGKKCNIVKREGVQGRIRWKIGCRQNAFGKWCSRPHRRNHSPKAIPPKICEEESRTLLYQAKGTDQILCREITSRVLSTWQWKMTFRCGLLKPHSHGGMLAMRRGNDSGMRGGS